MAHTFLNPDTVVAVANALVRKDLVLGATIGRDVATNFAAGRGASVNIRKPATLTASSRAVGATAAIATSTITEAYQTVTITEQAYNAVDLTDADLTLNIQDFGAQVLAPQSIAIGEYIEGFIASKLAALTAVTALSTGGTAAYSAAVPDKTFVLARKTLRDLGVPASGMFACVGTKVYADLLNSGKLSDVSTSGETSALRDATIGRLRGFTVLESNRIDEDDIFFYHRDAVQLVQRAPAKPRGATYGASVAQDGNALSWIMDYDATTMQDRSVLSCFLGLGLITVRVAGSGADVTPVLRVVTA